MKPQLIGWAILAVGYLWLALSAFRRYQAKKRVQQLDAAVRASKMLQDAVARLEAYQREMIELADIAKHLNSNGYLREAYLDWARRRDCGIKETRKS